MRYISELLVLELFPSSSKDSIPDLWGFVWFNHIGLTGI